MSENEPKSYDDQLNRWLDEDSGREADQGPDMPKAMYPQVAEAIVVHGLLTDMSRRFPAEDEMRVDSVMQAIEEPVAPEKSTSWSWLFGRPKQTAFTATAMIACVALIFIFQGINPTEAAAASLERIIAVAQQSIDRTYTIQVIDEYPASTPRNEKQGNIDGAILHVRGPDKYVLIRELKDGRQRLTGCDGTESWAMREDGPVHVSSDLNRFRGGLPGEQQDLPFINLQSQLMQLREKYFVESLPEAGREFEGRAMMGLVCLRKSHEVRGPKRVEIWADRETGGIHRMLMDNLPRGKGGPRSVMIQLTEESELPENFFSHTAHHESGRKIKPDKNQ